MKKIFLILLIPFLVAASNNYIGKDDPGSINGKDNATIASIIGVTFTQAGSGCSTSSNEVGYRTGGETSRAGSAGNFTCNLFTPDCTGPLNTAYMQHSGTESETCRVSIYLDDGDSTPDAGDTLVAKSGIISSSTDEDWAYSAMTTTPTVSSGSSYWVCRSTSATVAYGYYHGTGLSQYYITDWGDSYSNPPETLNPYGGEWSSNSDVKMSVYITIGP